jgi:hypothetical protein
MPKNMLIHDVGLQGRTPTDMAQNNWDVPAGTTTAHVMGWAAAYATSQHGLDNLFIMCHAMREASTTGELCNQHLTLALDWRSARRA